MRGVLAIARRDLVSTFLVPTGWIILAGWGLLAALVFVFATFREGQPATLRVVVSIAGWAMMIIAPAVSMRSFAEEARLGTLEVLLTSPLSALELVAGKLLAAIAVLGVLGLPILVLAGVSEAYGDPDPGELATGLLGLLLLGTTLVSMGILVSTRTSSQVVAYLVTFFAWFILILLAKGLPAILPELLPATFISSGRTLAWMDVVRGLDPIERLDDFAIGLFDSGNVAFFAGLAIFFSLASAFSLASPRRPRSQTASGRLLSGGFAVAGLLGLAVAVAAGTSLLSAPRLRVEADLTKTRAYSLRPSTIELLESLEPGWSIRMFVAQDDADPVTMRLVDEVVDRMDSATPSLIAERIDPVDPRSVGRYESVLESFLERDAIAIGIWEQEIDAGLEAFEALRTYGRATGPSIVEVIEGLPPGDPAGEVLERVGLGLGTLAEEGGVFTEFVEENLRSTTRRPLPNWRLVRASVAGNNANQATELEVLADALRGWTVDPALAPSVREWAVRTLPPLEQVAGGLRSTATSLETLERRQPLSIAVLADSIAEGDLAVVDGPPGSLVIPAWKLFPSSAIRESDAGAVVGFDRRFQGEEMLTSAIRALRIGVMPRVVIVHAEDRTMLRPTDEGMEYAAITEALRTARYEVEEWIPGRTERPVDDPDRVTVWVVMPTLQRTGLEYGETEKAVLAAATELIVAGEPVLLTVSRSLLPLVGQPDPWSTVAAGLGVTVDTGRVVFEWAPELADELRAGGSVVTYQEIDVSSMTPKANRSATPVATALRGKRLFLSHPTPVVVDDLITDDAVVLSAITPRPLRWLESDWRGDGARISGPPEPDADVNGEIYFDDPVPVAVAVETEGFLGEPQRLVVVGSGGWPLSAIVNESGNLGDQRLVLANPGNRELALSAVAWLAGLDELVATAATGREISRFEGVGGGTRTIFGFLLPVILGVGPLVFGAGLWSWRRSGR
ncbi:MAG: hypothetical protein CMJ51_01020 [Planctomycetaceae bacterium]|nr:hypothetical protein [Planctomycetaceae bacterium]